MTDRPAPTPPPLERSGRYCIVGAGPAGLAQARAFKEAGVAFDLFERHSALGGIWNVENTDTHMYDSAHMM